MDGLTYFVGQLHPSTGEQESALYKTDGTPGGTTLVSTIPGFGVYTYQAGTLFLDAGTKAYFLGDTTASGVEVWVTDGTAAGTHQISDIYKGQDSLSPALLGVVGTDLIFAENTTDYALQIYRTDGTAAGTHALTKFPKAKYGAVAEHLEVNGKVFVSLENPQSCCEPDLWVTDGTVAGTAQIDIKEDPTYQHLNPSSLRAFGTSVALLTDAPSLDTRMTFIDSKTNALTVIDTPTAVKYGSTVAAMDSFVLFLCGDPWTGFQLWRSDGTQSGTLKVADLGTKISSNTSQLEQDIVLTRVGNHAVFLAEDQEDGPQLWGSDGTVAGTLPLISAPTPGQPLIGVGGSHAYYAITTGADSRVVVTNGTPAGTHVLTGAGPVNANWIDHATYAVGGDTLAFIYTYYGPDAAGNWNHLYAYRPLTDTLTHLLDSPFTSSVDSTPLVDANELYFSETDFVHGDQPWVSDGSAAGTHIMADLTNNVPVAASPTVITFASTLVGTATQGKTLTISNIGIAPVSISAITVAGSQASDFSATKNCSAVLSAGATCSVSVVFKPTATGLRSAYLSVAYNSGGSPLSIPVSGTGTTAAPALQLSAAAVAFPNQVVNTRSATKSITVTNVGGTPLALNAIGLTGSQAHDFALSQNCGSTLASKASCTISVAFTPILTGTKTSTVSITDNATGSPHIVALTGTSTAPASVRLSMTSIAFADQAINTPSAPRSITLTNIGGAPLSFGAIGLIGSQAHDFSLTRTCEDDLPPGSSCVLNVAFTPILTGLKSSAISIADNASGSPQIVPLTGFSTGASVVTLTARALTFANQVIDTTSASQAITLSNSGTAPLTIASIGLTGSQAHDFKLSKSCSTTLAAGASCSVTVAFTPIVTGLKTATVSIVDSSTGSPHVITLSGTCVTGAAVRLSALSLSFADQAVNTSSLAQSITLTNGGTSPLQVYSIGLTGSQAHDFKVVNSCSSTLAAGSSCVVFVAFTPILTGAKTSTVSITDSALGSPHVVTLAGTGR